MNKANQLIKVIIASITNGKHVWRIVESDLYGVSSTAYICEEKELVLTVTEDTARLTLKDKQIPLSINNVEYIHTLLAQPQKTLLEELDNILDNL